MLRTFFPIVGASLLAILLVGCKADQPGKGETAVMNWAKHKILVHNKAQKNPLKDNAAGVADGKEAREFDGRTYIMERALQADFALVKAWKGDRWGNLVYRKTARNFNPMMATAAKITIAEVEHLVEPGELDPDLVHTPSVFVKRIFQGERFEKRIEKRTVTKPTATS